MITSVMSSGNTGGSDGDTGTKERWWVGGGDDV